MNRTRRTAAERRQAKDAALKSDAPDSIAVRSQLLDRVNAGEITLQQAQDELKRIQSDARRKGIPTLNDLWRNA